MRNRGFGLASEGERTVNLEKFKAKNPVIIDMLTEMKARIPWFNTLISSLLANIEYKGKLSDKQMSLVTSLYMDSCVISDEMIIEQQKARKLCYRLLELELGHTRKFVVSLLTNTDSRVFTTRQIQALKTVANRFSVRLGGVAVPADSFDGWFLIAPIKDIILGVDKPIG